MKRQVVVGGKIGGVEEGKEKGKGKGKKRAREEEDEGGGSGVSPAFERLSLRDELRPMVGGKTRRKTREEGEWLVISGWAEREEELTGDGLVGAAPSPEEMEGVVGGFEGRPA